MTKGKEKYSSLFALWDNCFNLPPKSLKTSCNEDLTLEQRYTIQVLSSHGKCQKDIVSEIIKN